MKQSETPMTAAAWIALLGLSVLWGGSFLFGRIAVAEIPPLTLVFLRVAIAALVLHLVIRLRGLRLPGRWRDFAVMGALNNIVPFSLIFFGQIEIGAGLAAVINGMTPFWAALVARGTGVEPLTPRKLTGIAVGFGGLAVMIGPDAAHGLDAMLIAQLAVVGATISYGCASVFGRRFSGTPALLTATGQLSASALLALPLALAVDAPWTLPAPSGATVGAVLALAVLATALAYILYFRVLAMAGATNVSLVTLLIPVSAMLLGTVILDESISVRQLVGMALIAAGLGCIDGRPLRLLRAAWFRTG